MNISSEDREYCKDLAHRVLKEHRDECKSVSEGPWSHAHDKDGSDIYPVFLDSMDDDLADKLDACWRGKLEKERSDLDKYNGPLVVFYPRA